jgi:hypothetical protein
MKNAFFFILSFLYFSSNAQEWDWALSINKDAMEMGRNIGVDKYGKVYLVGISRFTSGGHNNSWHNEWFYKFDSFGNLLWEKKIDAFFSKAVTDEDGNTYIISENVLNKYDSDGNFLWAKVMNATYNNIVLNKTNGVIITGKIRTDSLVSIISSINKEGVKNWERIGDASGNASYPFLNQIDSEESLFFVHRDIKNTLLFKINKIGQKVWQKDFTIPYPTVFTIDQNKNFYFGGYYSNLFPLIINGELYSPNSEGWFILKVNLNGEVLWIKNLGEQAIDFKAIASDKDNGICLSGNFTHSMMVDGKNLTSANTEAFVMKLNEEGNLVWIKQSSGGKEFEACPIEAMAIAPNGDVFITGIIRGNFLFDNINVNAPHSYGEMLVAKITGNNNVITTSIEEKETGYHFNIFPNPTHSNFTIHYHSENLGPISFKVRTLTGAIIYEAIEQKPTGKIEKQINLGSPAPGVYFVEVTSDGERVVKKLVVGR